MGGAYDTNYLDDKFLVFRPEKRKHFGDIRVDGKMVTFKANLKEIICAGVD
jgi:hypothetical protein